MGFCIHDACTSGRSVRHGCLIRFYSDPFLFFIARLGFLCLSAACSVLCVSPVSTDHFRRQEGKRVHMRSLERVKDKQDRSSSRVGARDPSPSLAAPEIHLRHRLDQRHCALSDFAVVSEFFPMIPRSVHCPPDSVRLWGILFFRSVTICHCASPLCWISSCR